MQLENGNFSDEPVRGDLPLLLLLVALSSLGLLMWAGLFRALYWSLSTAWTAACQAAHWSI